MIGLRPQVAALSPVRDIAMPACAGFVIDMKQMNSPAHSLHRRVYPHAARIIP